MLKIKYSSNLEDNYYKEIAKSKADKFKDIYNQGGSLNNQYTVARSLLHKIHKLKA